MLFNFVVISPNQNMEDVDVTSTDSMELENDSDTQDVNDIVLPSCIDLDWTQITYAINVKHLLFITNYKTWLNFHNVNPENSTKYMNYTAEQLCKRFIKRVLPNIYQYELTDHEEYLLSLLDLHPNFERTQHGFTLTNNTEHLRFPTDVAAIKPLISSATLQKMGFRAEVVHSNKQIIITDSSRQMCPQFMFSEENVALLSIIFSSDDELPTCILLTINEIRKRFKAAKNNFENSGQQPINVNISIGEILKKLSTIRELKVAIIKLLENFPGSV